MKKYSNLFISAGAYIVAILSVIFTGRIDTIPYFLFVVIGIILAFMAKRSKEKAWVPNLLIVIGILGILYPFVAWTGDY